MFEAVFAWLWWPLSLLLRPLPLALVAVTAAFVYWWLTRQYDFWTSRGVPGPPQKLPYGHGFPNARDFHGLDSWLYNEQGGKRFCGFFQMHRPVLHVGDPDLIRAITVKDFDHFTDRRDVLLNKGMEEMLVALSGRPWKELRDAMSPVFSASKLRAMHQLCLETAGNLSRYARETMAESGKVELKDAFGRFTMDNVATCCFGINCNSFRDPDSEFTKHAAQIFRPLSAYDLFRLLVLNVVPRRVGNLLPDRADPANAFLRRVATRTMAHRDEHGSTRRDYLQLLLETKNKTGGRAISDSKIATQAVMFLVAGYDTTASLLTFAGYALATSPECQQRAQQEIDEVLARHGGEVTYEGVSELHYLDRVLSETLRLYSPFGSFERMCVREYTLPGTAVTIPPGTIIKLPVLSLHRDPDHYPEPLRFDPDRFLPEQKERRHPCTYIPFGSGPRNCIAQRFALFEAKLALLAVLRENTLTPVDGTPLPPLPFDPGSLISTPKEPIFVKLLPRATG